MILVLSSDRFDQGTDPVLDWLLLKKAKFIKITPSDFFGCDSSVILSKERFMFAGLDLLKEINAIWFRKFDFYSVLPSFNKNYEPESQKVRDEILSEIKTIFSYLQYVLKDRFWLGRPSDISLNKLIVSDMAKGEIGISSPSFSIINNKSDLEDFVSENALVVNKKASDTIRYYYEVDGKSYFSLTHSLSNDDLNMLDDVFFPSFFQKQIAYDLEIRTIYVEGRFFSTAFVNRTQVYTDKKTVLVSNPQNSHVIPYKLEKDMEDKLGRFMQKLELNYGAIELIKDSAGVYHFIEVNPFGEFMSESVSCNYNIPKYIADVLILNDKT